MKKSSQDFRFLYDFIVNSDMKSKKNELLNYSGVQVLKHTGKFRANGQIVDQLNYDD